MRKTWIGLLAIGVAGFVSACAQQEEMAPAPITAEPTFDKYGNPECRPSNVPIGGAYTAELPLCRTSSGCVPDGEYISSAQRQDLNICRPGDDYWIDEDQRHGSTPDREPEPNSQPGTAG